MPGAVPKNPKIYHITHLDNLKRMVEVGMLYSDRQRIAKNLDCAVVGMSAIKRRRLEELPVREHPGTMVGDYVPFYFCPRSIMLYILHKGNHPDVTYREGQCRIVHLAADLHQVVAWAGAANRQWAFSVQNAGTRYNAGRFHTDLASLAKLDWEAILATDFRDAKTKEGKQAEFLVYESLPWSLIERIGVMNAEVKGAVEDLLASAAHKPLVTVESAWYY